MNRTALLVSILFVAAWPAGVLRSQTPTANSERYGPYPANYKEIVMSWLSTQLIDPDSARIDWTEEPKASDMDTKDGHLYGYMVHFKVDARNRFGAYTGKQTHGALIRNGEVIKGFGFGF